MNDKYPLALPIGSVLAGQYIIEKVLGEGGFGITYCAKDHKTGGYVAIKEFFPESMATRTNVTVVPYSGDNAENFSYGKDCFIQEAKTLAQFIGNENIIRIHSYFEENETAYFVMDYIEGVSFDTYIRNKGGKLSFDETLNILSPVMDALNLVHSRGIIHRDVTPDNIYITNSGVVKLLDFGAARYSLGDKSQSLDIILKHGFAPKEQYVRRGKQGPFTDVYALGATFYYALTGKRPQDSVERMDVDLLVPPSKMDAIISNESEQAILKALSVQPADRYQNMQEFKSSIIQGSQVNTSPVNQKFFNAPPSDVSQKVELPVNYSLEITQKSYNGNSVLDKFNAGIHKNIEVIRYADIALFIVFAIYAIKTCLPLVATANLISKIWIISISVFPLILSFALFKKNEKIIICGLAVRTVQLIILSIISYQSKNMSGLVFNIIELIIAAMLIALIEKKNVPAWAVYALGGVSLIVVIFSGFSWDYYVEAIAFVLIILIINEKGELRNGIN